MTSNQKEGLWWICGIILWIILLVMVFAVATPVCAQTNNPARIDFVQRSLDKTVEVGRNRAQTHPAPQGSGTRFIYKDGEGARYSVHRYGPQFESRIKMQRERKPRKTK